MGGGWVVGGWVLDFTRLMLISTQVEVVVEVGVELGNYRKQRNNKMQISKPFFLLLKTEIHICKFCIQSHYCAICTTK